MRKIFLFVLATFLMAVGAVHAAEITVDPVLDAEDPTNNYYVTAWAAAQDGDVLLLKPGNYAAALTLPAGKVITLKSADTNDKATLSFEWKGTVNLNYTVDDKNGGIIFDDLILTRSGGHFMNLDQDGQQGTIDIIAFRNCEITDVNRCLIQGNKTTFLISKIELTNNIVSECNKGDYNHMWLGTPVNELIFDNNTYYNNLPYNESDGNPSGSKGMEALFSARTASTHGINVVVKNNTIYQGGRKNGNNRYPMINTGGNYDPEASTYLFENNIIISPFESHPAHALLSASAALEVTIQKNLLHNLRDITNGLDTVVIIRGGVEVPGNVYSTPDGVDLSNNYSLADFGFESPAAPFLNPKGGDFTIYKGISPLATAGTDGGAIGALRWVQEAGDMFTLTTGYAAGSDNTMGSIDGPKGLIPANTEITLVAAKAFGHKFVKWVDATGATLSEEASYKFTLDADKTVLAEFATIPVYTLTINVEGLGGRVSYDNKGNKDEFKYEEGTEVRIEAHANGIAQFVKWSDDITETERYIEMNKDITLTAIFDAKSFIIGWDWSTYTDKNIMIPDYFGKGVDPNETYYALKVIYVENGVETEKAPGGLFRETDGRLAISHWGRRTTDGLPETSSGEPKADCTKEYFYWQVEFSSEGFGDVTVLYSLNPGNYKTHSMYNLEYSFNGSTWVKADEGAELIANTWYDGEVTIPNSGNRTSIFLRWMPNTSSPVLRDGRDVESLAITDFYFLAEGKGPWEGTGIDNLQSDAIDAWVNNGVLTIDGIAKATDADLFSIDGRLVANFDLNAGTTTKNFSSLKGIYILRVNGATKKLIF